MKLSLLLAALLWSTAVTGYAQELAQQPAQRDVADLLATLRSDQVLRVPFTEEVTLPFLKHPLVSKGMLVIHPDGHLIRTVSTPNESATVMTQSKVVVKDKSGATTIDATAAPQVVAAVKVLRSVLTGQVDGLRAHYEVAVDAPTDRASWIVTLRSREKQSNFFEQCVVSGEAERVMAVTLNEPDGVVRRITFQPSTSSAELNGAEKALLKLATAGE